MNLVNNIDKVFQDNIAKNYEGISSDSNGVFITLADLRIPLLDKNGRTVDNRLSELSEAIRLELSGLFDTTPELMKAFVDRAEAEINAFFVQIALSWVDSLKAKVASEQKILEVYESRKMIDFIPDSGFKTKAPNKAVELNNFANSIGINDHVSYDNAAEIKNLKSELDNCKNRYENIVSAYNIFLLVMKDMVDLTLQVKRAKSSDAQKKDNAIKNLDIINQISYTDMRQVPDTAKVSLELAKKLLTAEMSPADFLSELQKMA